MASDRTGDGLGGFVVEGTAALTILLYFAVALYFRELESANQHAGRFLFGACASANF
jgi:hypothetical protein